MSAQSWASDAPVSLPAPPEQTLLSVPMYGFVFTENGLFHDLTEADHEVLRTPTFAPPDQTGGVVYDDGHS